jgi:predicted glycosyltransferase
MHDALAFARFFLGDSQTMAVEAAVLGTPAFQVSDLVGRLSVLNELSGYGLVFGVPPGEEATLLARLREALAEDPRHRAARRERMLAEKIDPLSWFVDQAEALAAEAASGQPARLAPAPAPGARP